MGKDKKIKYYTLDKINGYKAHYNIIIGERSNGKTYAALLQGITNYVRTGKQMAIVRRWNEDFIGKRGAVMFGGIEANGEVARLTDGMYNHVYYYASKWYMALIEDGKIVSRDEIPFCYAFAISSMEHDKSTSYPNITTIVYDEFISRGTYLQDEFVLYMNVLSTIIRKRKDVTIYMLGNTVNKYCPYFAEMGLKHIKDMRQGTIDVYKYGESALTVAVEYCTSLNEGAKSDTYFAFDNPKLNMIKQGAWELDLYPHCPCKYRPQDVVYRYYIVFDTQICECEVVLVEDKAFTFIHPKTTELKADDNTLVYTTDFNPSPNYRRCIHRPQTPLEKKILSHFVYDQVYYADNETGELVNNYLLWCKREHAS